MGLHWASVVEVLVVDVLVDVELLVDVVLVVDVLVLLDERVLDVVLVVVVAVVSTHTNPVVGDPPDAMPQSYIRTCSHVGPASERLRTCALRPAACSSPTPSLSSAAAAQPSGGGRRPGRRQDERHGRGDPGGERHRAVCRAKGGGARTCRGLEPKRLRELARSILNPPYAEHKSNH